MEFRLNLFHRMGADPLGVGVALLAALTIPAQGEAQDPASQLPRDRRLAIVATREASPLVRFHFDEPVQLRLDPDRIAVWAPRGVGAVLPAVVTPGSAEALAVPGWHLLHLEAPVDAAGLPALLEVVAGGAGCEFVSPVFIDDLGGPLVPTRDLLVQFEPDIGQEWAEAVLASLGTGSILDRDWGGLPGAFRVRSASSTGLVVLAAANALAQRPDVRFAEPDFLFTGRGEQTQPNDPSLARSWGLISPAFSDYCPDVDWDMGAFAAWQVTQGDPSIRVLIIDTGVDPLHPDLNQDPGEDFTGQGGGGAPVNACDNHGTKVAGCVSMTAGNGLGSAGIAPGSKIVSARVFISKTPVCGGWNSNASWTVNALQWAADNGIWITNNSNIYGFTSSAIEAKYQQTRADGAIHFAAAGNGGQNQVAYPANIESVNAIGNFTYWGYVNASSNYGPEIAFVAPGTGIFTTDRSGAAGAIGDYTWATGTSFASPFTAGVAALLRSQDSTLSPDAIEARLRSTASDLGTPGWDEHNGWGLIRAGRAMTQPKWQQAVRVPFGSTSPPEPKGTCDRPSFSDDGRYVAFRSRSSQLVPSDTNGVPDVFVRDLQTQTVVRVSVDSSGAEANGESFLPSISGNGRYVSFDSVADNLVVGDTNGRRDVFLHDTQTGLTSRISEGPAGVQGNANSFGPSISEDGRYVAFQSYATTFDPAANGLGQVYVHDTQTATMTLATKAAGGQAADGHSHLPSISDDGTRVAFFSRATNLVTGSNGKMHAFVCDLGTSTFFLASLDTTGTQNTEDSYRTTISGDGKRVTFWTTGALHPADANGLFDVYVRDLGTGVTLAASTNASGAFGTRDSFGLQLSADGRYVVVLSATPLVPGDTNEHVDAFRKDLQTGAVIRVSLRTGGQQALGGSTHPWISPDGGLVGFVCTDDLLAPGDELDGYSDVYLHTVATGQTILATAGS